MPSRILSPRLNDILEAIDHIRSVISGLSLGDFEGNWEKRWLVERGVEIISEASRHLPEDLKRRQPTIPWRKVAGIGNVLRHNYEHIAPEILWNLIHEELAPLEKACRVELAAALVREQNG